MLSRNIALASFMKRNRMSFTTGNFLRDSNKKKESERMKNFREKLNSEIPIEDPLLVETDPKSGEYIPECEKNPTKWGDWQIAGRVSDF